jgi:putative heme-binding domain-containing protein
VDAGAAIFFGQAGCSGCHMIRGRGGFIGPDLTDIGALRTVVQLRESLLKPSARIADGYEGVKVTLRDGSTLSGVARNANNYSMQILDRKGALRLLAMEEVRDVEFRQASLMPEDFGKRLSASDIDNVLAFLSRQSVRPPGERGAEQKSRGNRK